MYIYIMTESCGAIQQSVHETFEEAFEACSKNMEIDFAGHYVYHKDKVRDFIKENKCISYNFGWYGSVYQYVNELTNEPVRFYPKVLKP